MANFLGLLVARTAALGGDARQTGLGPRGAALTAYASIEAHSCVKRAMELAGHGSDSLRGIPVDQRGAIRTDLLAAAIAADRAEGRTPFLIIATAGSVNIGAFDDLNELARIAEAERIWLHVDGAFGALAAFSDQLKHRIAGIERADSVAFDFHKWAHVPYDAGFLIVRDPNAHYRAFADRPAYLAHSDGGLAGGGIWPCDLGLDLSRSFRALKTWFTFEVFGAQAIAAAMERTCRVAQHLEALIAAGDVFEIRAPVALNIVCFSVKLRNAGSINQQIVIDLHERGLAAPSTTKISGEVVIRAAIVNHRTTESDMDAFMEALVAAAKRLNPAGADTMTATHRRRVPARAQRRPLHEQGY
jgi:aromatic-L-amino-acid decarboxylase